jgi:hydrogenase maturation protein HypF
MNNDCSAGVRPALGAADESSAIRERLQVRILGIVQGVGFRPFVYRLARELNLSGWVRNDSNGVTIEVEGDHSTLLSFLQKLHSEKPRPALLYAVDHRFLVPAGYDGFEITSSEAIGSPLAWILPDLATCDDCLREMNDPSNRRFRYPFTNCTHCGTRFTIIENLPYDRPRTSMKIFQMCDLCRQEYEDPADRRFHAQPNACPDCGPQLSFLHADGRSSKEQGALLEAEEWIRAGRIVALKGLGGYHLIVDARNEDAVLELRRRKLRQNKPFAVMYPNLSRLQAHVNTAGFAGQFLGSAQSPILLLTRKEQSYREIAPSVAPHSPYLGVFLPYTPLHHLLLQDLDFPVVATSGNLVDEPIQFDDREAMEKLGHICDGFLTHNRPIDHHADDSVVQIVESPQAKSQMLRRARGYTPLPMLAPQKLPPLLAVGGHMNVTFAVTRDREIILSQHLGDMDGKESRSVYEKSIRDFLKLYKIQPECIVHDLHPAYFSTDFARRFDLPLMAVQHHHAHMAACMLENEIEGEALGLTWDGTGYGPDRTIWGGEFLLGSPASYQRVASLHPFRLPGGEKAIKQPWRTALALLHASFGSEIPRDLPLFSRISEKLVNGVLQIVDRSRFSPITSSMGRLFDGISAILGLCEYNTHQAEAAQLLEYAAWKNSGKNTFLPLPILHSDILRLDWRPLIRELVKEYSRGRSIESLAAAFHRSLATASLEVSRRFSQQRIVLSGGVFCNRFLTEELLSLLNDNGIRGFTHSQLPPTDGSLSVGQAWVAANQLLS